MGVRAIFGSGLVSLAPRTASLCTTHPLSHQRRQSSHFPTTAEFVVNGTDTWFCAVCDDPSFLPPPTHGMRKLQRVSMLPPRHRSVLLSFHQGCSIFASRPAAFSNCTAIVRSTALGNQRRPPGARLMCTLACDRECSAQTRISRANRLTRSTPNLCAQRSGLQQKGGRQRSRQRRVGTGRGAAGCAVGCTGVGTLLVRAMAGPTWWCVSNPSHLGCRGET